MSFVSEKQATILEQLVVMRDRQTAANQNSLKSGTVEELCYLPSPLNVESMMRADLERELSLVQHVSASPTITNSAPRPIKKPGEQSKKSATHSFEISKDPSQFKFTKVVPKAPNDSISSELSAAVKKMMKDARPMMAHKMVMRTLNVHFPTLESITIQVADKTIVEEVIKVAMQQYEIECSEKKKQVRINLNPKAYALRFAEDDGAPDEDLPALVRTQEIGNFRGKDFALVPDTSFKVMKSTTNRTEEAIPKVPLFKVYLPNEQGFVSVAYEYNTTLSHVLDVVCKKRAIDPVNYYFDFYDGDSATAKGEPHNMNEILGQLGVGRLQLLEKKKSFGHKRNPSGKIPATIGDTGRRASVHLVTNLMPTARKSKGELGGDATKALTKRTGPLYFFTPITAMKYQEFSVVKYNKFGVKQERTMGIDDQKITNVKPETGKKEKVKVKRPERAIKEVLRAWVSTTRPDQFYIEFKEQTYKYESPAAEEIVAKVMYLVAMYEEDRQRMEKSNN